MSPKSYKMDERTFRNLLKETGLFTDEGSDVRLIGTPFKIWILDKNRFYWLQKLNNGLNQVTRVRFSTVLEEIPFSLKEKLVYHLDFFL